MTDTKIWAGTASGSTHHAFEDGRALCNKGIRPHLRRWNESSEAPDYMTRAQVESLGSNTDCARCLKKVAALAAQAEREDNAEVRTLPLADVSEVCNDRGEFMYLGNASTHKRPQGFPRVAAIEDQGRGIWHIVDARSGAKIAGVRRSTFLYVARVPANIEELDAQAEALADSVSLEAVETSVPAVDQAPEVEPKVWAGTASNREHMHAFTDGKAACNPRIRPWAPDAMHTRADIHRDVQGASFCDRCMTRLEELRAVESADRYIEREAPRVAALLGEGEELPEVDPWAPQSDAPEEPYVSPWGEGEELPEAPKSDAEIADAAADRAERKAFEDAKARAERLRNRKAHTMTVRAVKAPANFRDLARSGNTEAARRYWTRRCAEFEMVETVKAHAVANYDLGWDTVVECYSDAEILEYCRSEYVNVSTPEDAVKAFDDLADEWASRQCGALVDGYGV